MSLQENVVILLSLRCGKLSVKGMRKVWGHDQNSKYCFSWGWVLGGSYIMLVICMFLVHLLILFINHVHIICKKKCLLIFDVICLFILDVLCLFILDVLCLFIHDVVHILPVNLVIMMLFRSPKCDINSLAPGRCRSTCNFKSVNSEHMLWLKFISNSGKIALRWMPQNTFTDKSTLFRWWLGTIRQPAITRANVDRDLWHH